MRSGTLWKAPIHAFASAWLALSLLACNRPSPPVPVPAPARVEGPATPATAGEQRAILTAVLPRYLALVVRAADEPGRTRPTRLVLVTPTVSLCALSSADACARIRDADFAGTGRRATAEEMDLLKTRGLSEGINARVRHGELSPVLAQALMAANRTPMPLPHDGWPPFVDLMPKSDMRALLSGGTGIPDWPRLHASLPGAVGYAEASQAVISADKRRALVYVGFKCGGRCGAGELHLLERHGDAWRVVGPIKLWES